jgi:HK97 family phage major capsid protein
MNADSQRQAEELRKQLLDLGDELRDPETPQDRVTAIEAEIEVKAQAFEAIQADNRVSAVESKYNELEERLKAFTRETAKTKAQAILAGVGTTTPMKSVGRYNETNFLSALVARRLGDQDAQEFVKGVLGTSTATGTAIIPANFVADLVAQLALTNVYRSVFAVNNGVVGAGVNIPYEVTAVTAALVQGAYGSNKDVRDFSFNSATATLYTIAQIADIGNQLLRQSNGAAERAARRRLAGSIGMTEATWITNGSGSSQPLGFFQAILAFGDPAGFRTALSSEPRVATIGRAIGALEGRGSLRSNLIFVCNPTDYWEMAAEGLGTSYAGGWAIDPAGGAAAAPPLTSAWGVPLLVDPNWPSAKAGTGLLIDKSEVDIFTGQEYRIDVSSEGGNRFDQNITGFRAEEEFAFNAEPYVRTGRVQQVTGI